MPSIKHAWQPIGTAPEGVAVVTKIDDGRGVRNERVLIRHRGVWAYPGRDTRVYYTPTHWKPVGREWAI